MAEGRLLFLDFPRLPAFTSRDAVRGSPLFNATNKAYRRR